MKGPKPTDFAGPEQSLSPRMPTKASEATIARIIDSARHVLVKHGYAEFTTRRVAKAAGIAVGNLSYHFPSKRKLLQAVVTRLVAEYSDQFQQILAQPNAPSPEDLQDLVHFLLTDAITEEGTRTFRELWAISLHDKVIKEAMDRLYDDLMGGVVEMLRRYFPDSDVRPIQELAQLLALISEGSIVLYGTSRDRVVPHERIIELATSLIKTMALDLKVAGDESEET